MFLSKVKGIKKIVVAERTPITLQQFTVLQKFAVIELELDLIPITENTLHVLIVQMVSSHMILMKQGLLICILTPLCSFVMLGEC